MTAVAFTCHGIEFGIERIGGDYNWFYYDNDGLFTGGFCFPTVETAKADAIRYAEAHTTTVTSNARKKE